MNKDEKDILVDLTARITHELNTPLTYTLSNTELLLEDIKNLSESENKQYLLEDVKIILDGLHRMSNVVELLREISAPSYEEKQSVNLYSSIISSITLQYSNSKHISNIYINNLLFDLDLKTPNDNFIVLVQEKRIITLWNIIITNAIDALKTNDESEKRFLNITLKNDSKHIIVIFEDNGGGIKADILKNIFNYFVNDRKDGGMGIGLRVAQKIIDDNNATISASNLNNGARFEVRLPLT